MTDKEHIVKLQEEIINVKECMIEPLIMLETYWRLIPKSHKMTCREWFPEAFILTGLEVSDERN